MEAKSELLNFANQTSYYTTSDGRKFRYEDTGRNDGLSVPAFYSGVRFIAETLARLPKHVLQTTGNQRKKVDHYTNELMSEFPNTIVNAVYLWETAIGHAVMYGDGIIYAPKRNGKVVGLYNLYAPLVIIFRTSDGRQKYALHDGTGKIAKDEDGKPLIFDYNEIIHIRNYSDNGEKGICVIDQLAAALQLPQRLDKFINMYFEQGAAVNIAVETAEKCTKEDIDTIKYGIESNHGGIENAHKVMVLSKATAKNLAPALEQFAFDVLKEATVEDIARILRVNPAALYALAKTSSYNSLEQLGRELVQFSFASWILKIELECKRVLLSPQERQDGLYIRWNIEGLQRGDFQARVTAGVQLVNNRLMTPNEWRALEDLEPYEGGDVFYGPLNTPEVGAEDGVDTAGDEPIDEPAKEPEPVQDPSIAPEVTAASNENAIANKYKAFLEDAKKRVVTKQLKAFSNASKKAPEAFDEWVNRFADEQGIYLGEALNPFLETLIQDKTDLSFKLQNVVELYSALVRKDKENADPQEVIDQLLKRLNEKN